jgi:hypothetical protein
MAEEVYEKLATLIGERINRDDIRCGSISMEHVIEILRTVDEEVGIHAHLELDYAASKLEAEEDTMGALFLFHKRVMFEPTDPSWFGQKETFGVKPGHIIYPVHSPSDMDHDPFMVVSPYPLDVATVGKYSGKRSRGMFFDDDEMIAEGVIDKDENGFYIRKHFGIDTPGTGEKKYIPDHMPLLIETSHGKMAECGITDIDQDY